MIAVFENKDAPKEIRECSPDAPWFMVEDPGGGMAAAEAEQETRRHWKVVYCVIFTQHDQRVNGKIVYIGHKINPLIANMDL